MGGGHDLPTTPATPEEMANANLAIGYRDACAHLLIPLNKRAHASWRWIFCELIRRRRRCRRKTFYMPWECGHLCEAAPVHNLWRGAASTRVA